MTDLVERLREIGAHYSACDRQQTIYEAATALEASQAQASAPINPDMPAHQLRLHMGELSASELRVARAAIRWANTVAQAQAAEVRRETIATCADIARCAFDDRPRIRAGNVDWADGYDEATRAAEAAIRALTDAAKEPDHFPDAGNMIDKPEGDHFPDTRKMVNAEEDRA